MSGDQMVELVKILRRAKARPRVVLMPDFFLDHIVYYDGEASEFVQGIMRTARRGGGNLSFNRQRLIRGGNAANTAIALTCLGGDTSLIARTDELGKWLLGYLTRAHPMDLSLVKSSGRPAATVAIEMRLRGRPVNVMVSDPGSVVDFGPDQLSEDDWKAILEADYVCVLNWNQNLQGTDLAAEVFSRVKSSGKGKTFLDTGDPSIRKEGHVQELMRQVLAKGIVDILSLNENEAVFYGSRLSKALKRSPKGLGQGDPASRFASLLHREFRLQVDVHTPRYAASFVDGEQHVIRAFRRKVRTTTGAGDAWNAGDIFGDYLRLWPQQRLLLANAAAAFYVSNEKGKHAALRDVANVLRENALRGGR